MKKIAFGISTLAILIGTPACAADIIVKAAPQSSPPAGTWTGFYAGLNIGGGWGQANNTFVDSQFAGAQLPIAIDDSHPRGVIGGGQFGYNWEAGAIVLGVETDIQGSGQRGAATAVGNFATCAAGCSISETDKLAWFGTTRGRIGVASRGWLAYFTAGVAYGGLNSSGNWLVPAFGTGMSFSNSSTRAGWTLGGGIETQLIGKWT